MDTIQVLQTISFALDGINRVSILLFMFSMLGVSVVEFLSMLHEKTKIVGNSFGVAKLTVLVILILQMYVNQMQWASSLGKALSNATHGGMMDFARYYVWILTGFEVFLVIAVGVFVYFLQKWIRSNGKRLIQSFVLHKEFFSKLIS